MQLLTAASVAITTNIALLFFQDLLPRETGVATAIFTNSWSVGNLLGFFTFGLLLPRVGHRGLYFTCATLAAAASLLLIARPAPLVHRQRD
jgi:SET family sugar efflux transporter-like MFS transporter